MVWKLAGEAEGVDGLLISGLAGGDSVRSRVVMAGRLSALNRDVAWRLGSTHPTVPCLSHGNQSAPKAPSKQSFSTAHVHSRRSRVVRIFCDEADLH